MVSSSRLIDYFYNLPPSPQQEPTRYPDRVLEISFQLEWEGRDDPKLLEEGLEVLAINWNRLTASEQKRLMPWFAMQAHGIELSENDPDDVEEPWLDLINTNLFDTETLSCETQLASLGLMVLSEEVMEKLARSYALPLEKRDERTYKDSIAFGKPDVFTFAPGIMRPVEKWEPWYLRAHRIISQVFGCRRTRNLDALLEDHNIGRLGDDELRLMTFLFHPALADRYEPDVDYSHITEFLPGEGHVFASASSYIKQGNFFAPALPQHPNTNLLAGVGVIDASYSISLAKPDATMPLLPMSAMMPSFRV